MVNESISRSSIADSINTTDDSKGTCRCMLPFICESYLMKVTITLLLMYTVHCSIMTIGTKASNTETIFQNGPDSNTLANGKAPVISDTPLSSGQDRTEQDIILKMVQENQAKLDKILMLLEQDKGTVILQEIREGKELSKDSIELLREAMGKLENKQVIEDTDADEQSLEDPVYKSDDLQSNCDVHESTEASAHQSNDSSSSTHQSNDSSSSAHQSHDPEDPTDQSNDPESPTDQSNNPESPTDQSQELNSNNAILTPSTDGNQLQHDRSVDQVERGAADQDNHSSTINDNVSISDDEDKSGCDS